MLNDHWSAKLFIVAVRLMLVVIFFLAASMAIGGVYYGTMQWRAEQEAKYLTIVGEAQNTDYIPAEFYSCEVKED